MIVCFTDKAFNNMRMAWENIVVFAVATGRTLVLLPERFFPYITDVSKISLSIFTLGSGTSQCTSF